MVAELLARTDQVNFFEELEKKKKSAFVAIYGRRRVGKTFLVRKHFEGRLSFYVTGVANINTTQQLLNFHLAIKKQYPQSPDTPPATWLQAFQLLIEVLEKTETNPKIVFIDELPWFDTAHSAFIPALEHFWNSWAANRNDIILITCGSAASWMLNKLINNTGGLHNRVTHRIKLEPFTLREVEMFFKNKNAAFDRYQLVQLYMAMGGIPYYLEMIDTGLSAAQNIDKLCFVKNAPLQTEFTILYRSLFKKADNHIAIIEALSKKAKGLSRDELLRSAKMANGGGATRVLKELEECNFIRRYPAFEKKGKNSLYQLSDFYSLFYLRFIKNVKTLDENTWLKKIDSPDYRAWSGYAFEQVCLWHLQQIKIALGISGIHSSASSWVGRTEKSKAQIDLLIDRRDQVINLCEMKFSISPFTIDKAYSDELRKKIGLFREGTGTRKAIYLTMITTYGITQNQYAGSLVQNNLTMDALFH